MDIDFEIDDIREEEKNIMQLEVDGIVLEIPEELINRRKETLFYDSQKENLKDIKDILSGYIKDFKNNRNHDDDLNQKIYEWLESELDLYTPTEKQK